MKHKVFILYSIVSVLILACVMVFVGMYEECREWKYHAATGTPVQSIQEAMVVFREYLPSEEYYHNYSLPNTIEEYKERFNIVPFQTTISYLSSETEFNTINIFNMLLGYAIGNDGSIYKYERC